MSPRERIPLREMFRAATHGVLAPARADEMLDDAFDAIAGRRGADVATVWDRLSAQLRERLAAEIGISRADMMLERIASGVRIALRFGPRSPALASVGLVLVGYPRGVASEIASSAGISCAVAQDLGAIQAAVRRGVVHEGVVVAIDPADAAVFPGMLAAVRGSEATVVIAGASPEQRELAKHLLGDRVLLLDAPGAPAALGAVLREVFAAW